MDSPQLVRNGLNLTYGLRGFPLGPPTHTSSVDAERGVSYAGTLIGELIHLEPEEVIGLLMGGDPELQEFAAIPPEYHARLSSIHAEDKDPMVLLNQMVLELSDWWEADLATAKVKVIASMPHLVAAAICRSRGMDIPTSHSEMGLIENFVNMLPYEWKDGGALRKLKLHYILHLDHGGGNLSTQAAKTVASGRPKSAAQVVSAGINALHTDLHGTACPNAYAFQKRLVDDGIGDDQLANFLKGEIAEGLRIPGYGHAKLTVADPRGVELAKGLVGSDDPVAQMALKLAEVAPGVIREIKKRDCPPNVDAYSGAFLASLGVPPEDFMLFFAVSRTVGWIIQSADYLEDGGQLMRPIYPYTRRK